MCTICDLNDRLAAPLGGFISSLVAKGLAIIGKTIFNKTAKKQDFKTQLYSAFIFIIYIRKNKFEIELL